MSASGTPPAPPPPSNPALDVTGISWITKRLKVPSRNTLIFLSVTSSILGLYIHDRRECKRIKQEYIDKVKHFSEETSDHLGWPRKVTVYGSKWPGDEDYDQCIKYFRQYVKPILVAAAVDFEMVTGKKHGDLANRIADEVKKRRRLELGWEREGSAAAMPPAYEFRSKELLRQQELDGGIVIVGRPTWKEFMHGLKRGWTESPAKVDADEVLARELADDGRFDEVDPVEEDAASPAQSYNASFYNSLQQTSPKPTPTTQFEDPAMPSSIPALPPILFVSFTDYIGFKLIPLMLYDFFNKRQFVKSGAEAAYRLIMKQTRPFDAPAPPAFSLFDEVSSDTERPKSDLDFDRHSEGYYQKSLDGTEAEIERQRRKYYEELPAKLATARELARNVREPTKDEVRYPPPTEVELSAERMKKEQRWRHAVAGWEIVKPSAEVAWDTRFEGIFTVFTDPPEQPKSGQEAHTATFTNTD